MAVSIQKENFNTETTLQSFNNEREEIGAICHFVGMVRGGDVAFLELEHHEDMSSFALEALEVRLKKEYDILDCLLIHRYGKLRAGENIVLVAVASSHRESAFRAMWYAMETMKTEIPFWKCEHYHDGKKKWLTPNG